MSGFKQPDLSKRQEAAGRIKKAALEKFRAKAADPGLAVRLTERMAQAADRKTIKNLRAAERAETESREAERTQQAERDAARQAERAKAEGEERETEQKAARDARYAARKSRSKRR